mmetsp:Transcript_28594/g.53620  ORF Transcript_28594/g.53620 Transcript_28594/m.53620 type:complete len:211 (+) Transcript_28594:397-1029(+)
MKFMKKAITSGACKQCRSSTCQSPKKAAAVVTRHLVGAALARTCTQMLANESASQMNHANLSSTGIKMEHAQNLHPATTPGLPRASRFLPSKRRFSILDPPFPTSQRAAPEQLREHPSRFWVAVVMTAVVPLTVHQVLPMKSHAKPCAEGELLALGQRRTRRALAWGMIAAAARIATRLSGDASSSKNQGLPAVGERRTRTLRQTSIPQR